MLRAAFLASLIWLTTSSVGSACIGYPYTEGIAYFEAVPDGLTEDDIALDVVFDDDQLDLLNGVVLARVRRVLHGDYDGNVVHVGLGNSSCTDSFQFGRAGVIVGRIITPVEGQARVDALENQTTNAVLRMLWPFSETVFWPVTETHVARELRIAGLQPLSNGASAFGDYDGDGQTDIAEFYEDNDGSLVIGVRLTSRGEVIRIWEASMASRPDFSFNTAPAGAYRTMRHLYGTDSGVPYAIELAHDALILNALEGPAEFLFYWNGETFQNVVISE